MSDEKRTTQEILESIEASTIESVSMVFTFGMIICLLLFAIATILGWSVLRVYLV